MEWKGVTRSVYVLVLVLFVVQDDLLTPSTCGSGVGTS